MKKIIAGVDEVGRGSLVGPVYAAAVILNKKINTKLLKDSKSLSKQDRERLNIYIKKNSFWSIGKASIKEIEELNILNASLLAMKRAIKKLNKKPSLVMIDGNKTPDYLDENGDIRINVASASLPPPVKKLIIAEPTLSRKLPNDLSPSNAN